MSSTQICFSSNLRLRRVDGSCEGWPAGDPVSSWKCEGLALDSRAAEASMRLTSFPRQPRSRLADNMPATLETADTKAAMQRGRSTIDVAYLRMRRCWASCRLSTASDPAGCLCGEPADPNVLLPEKQHNEMQW